MGNLVCNRCGTQSFADSDMYVTKGGSIVCVDCLRAGDVIKCRECGNKLAFEDAYISGDEAYCPNCISVCSWCGATITPNDDCVTTPEGDLCASCGSEYSEEDED